MGYRSEVSFCLQVKKPQEFVALLKLRDDEVIKDMMRFMYLDEQGLIHFYHEHWKWYEDSNTALGEIMEMAENYDDNFAGRFARYGEETDDNEEDAWGNDGWDLDYPYVVRSLELGFNPSTTKKLLEEESNGSE